MAGTVRVLLSTTHSWQLPIRFAERLNNSNIFALLILFAILGLSVGTNIIINFFELIGVQSLYRIFFKKETEIENNPDYIHALSARTLVSRILTGKYLFLNCINHVDFFCLSVFLFVCLPFTLSD